MYAERNRLSVLDRGERLVTSEWFIPFWRAKPLIVSENWRSVSKTDAFWRDPPTKFGAKSGSTIYCASASSAEWKRSLCRFFRFRRGTRTSRLETRAKESN